EPGPHIVAAGWEEKTQSRELTASAGGSSTLAFTPPKENAPSASTASSPSATTSTGTEISLASPSKRGLSPAFTYVGIGLTVALGGASIWSGLDAQSNPGPDKVKERCVGLGERCPEYQDGLSRQRRTNILLAATGGTAILTGIVASLFTNWSSASSPTTAHVPSFLPGVSLDTQGATFHAVGRF
ncbi:MAG: hypothetical protein NZX77_22930, partial [Polyangiaceae bacterium]|nr:hypothetical protein [Polyangiaceae bacterium]